MLNQFDFIKEEEDRLSKHAFLSKNALRKEPEASDFRLPFEVDKTKILSCKAFRRLKHKTQVFLNPKGDHYRTRLTHTLEVANVSKLIARHLSLNEDLTEAIALGHDIGHCCFGHAGEAVLKDILNTYAHNKQSLRVADHIEKLNLTDQVRDGILNHTGETTPKTLEGQIVKISDRIAYLHHDIDDAIRAKVIVYEDIPADIRRIFPNLEDVHMNLMEDIIAQSYNKNTITLSKDIENTMLDLRKFMFDIVYLRPSSKKEIDKAKYIVKTLTKYYLDNTKEMPDVYIKLIEQWGKETAVVDYISGMTDGYAISKYEEIFLPKKYDIM